jgi:hypothetical protein
LWPEGVAGASALHPNCSILYKTLRWGSGNPTAGGVTAVKAAAISQAGTPTVTGVQAPTVTAVRAVTTTAAAAPFVTAGTVTPPNATTSTAAGTPTVTAVQNVTVTAVKAAATSQSPGTITVTGGTTYINDSFTGTNGAAWNATYWTSAVSTAGATTNIQSNQGRMNAGTLTGWTGKKGMRYTGGAVADTNISGKFTFVNLDTIDCNLQVITRTDSALAWTNGYGLFILPGSAAAYVQKNVLTVNTTLGTIAMTFTQGTQYGFRFRVVGTAIQARIWTGVEPGTWNVDTTDSSITGAAYFGLMCGGGNPAGGIVDIDDILAQ